MTWVEAYRRAWAEDDVDAVDALFTPDATYLRSPYEEPLVGSAAIRAIWLEDRGEPFTLAAEPIAVEGDDAVVRVEVRYGEPLRQEYRDLWVLRFAADGRVERYEEWPFWPGKPWSARGDEAEVG
jgi:ketosteroid isomerase-like protein